MIMTIDSFTWLVDQSKVRCSVPVIYQYYVPFRCSKPNDVQAKRSESGTFGRRSSSDSQILVANTNQSSSFPDMF